VLPIQISLGNIGVGQANCHFIKIGEDFGRCKNLIVQLCEACLIDINCIDNGVIRHCQITLKLSIGANEHLCLVEECPQRHLWRRETASIRDVVILDLSRCGQRELPDIHFEVQDGDHQESDFTSV
jgi:hypothetical protein